MDFNEIWYQESTLKVAGSHQSNVTPTLCEEKFKCYQFSKKNYSLYKKVVYDNENRLHQDIQFLLETFLIQ